VTELRVSARADERVAAAVRLAEAAGVSIRRVPPGDLERAARGAGHQGIVADVRAAEAFSVEDLVMASAGPPLLVVLDSIEDPQNVGAILRTVDAAGAGGWCVSPGTPRRSAGPRPRPRAGAVSHVKVAEVVNVARALDALKNVGVWTIGLTGDAPRRYHEMDLTLPTAVVVGAEGTGLRRLVRERCDWLVSIPMRGHVESLNASVAAGIVLFEAVRQRGLK
jgi:23S rRNA (guanosine2251-2'-O)-methyltransferase